METTQTIEEMLKKCRYKDVLAVLFYFNSFCPNVR
jgi:hypothetical protein